MQQVLISSWENELQYKLIKRKTNNRDAVVRTVPYDATHRRTKTNFYDYIWDHFRREKNKLTQVPNGKEKSLRPK